MRARRIARALGLAAAVVAAALVAGAVGPAAPAIAGESVCDEGVLSTGEAPLPCAVTEPPPTETETTPVEPPPGETETTVPELPPIDTEPTEPDEPPEPSSTPAKPPPPAAAPPPPGLPPGGVFGSQPHSGTPTLRGGPYVFPVIGATSYGDTWGAPRATVAWHHGVDIFAPIGAPVVAVADGVLFSVGWNRIGGWRLWLRDREGNYFYYAHLSSFAPVAVDGARVRAGTIVGYVGDTGDAEGTPPHLHFEIHPVSLLSLGYDGAVNPFPYVSEWPEVDEVVAAAGSGSAPAPGAILLGYTDISSASGLAPATLEQTVEDADVAATQVYDAAPAPATSRAEIPRPSDAHAELARMLDAEAAEPVRYSASVWDTLAVCESGSDWGANTGNGFFGGLQFHPGTWASHGGLVFAQSAHLATREQQIAIARRVLETQGWAAWPACSAVLGLWALDNG